MFIPKTAIYIRTHGIYLIENDVYIDRYRLDICPHSWYMYMRFPHLPPTCSINASTCYYTKQWHNYLQYMVCLLFFVVCFFAGKYTIPAIGGLIILTFSIVMAVCYNYRNNRKNMIKNTNSSNVNLPYSRDFMYENWRLHYQHSGVATLKNCEHVLTFFSISIF